MSQETYLERFQMKDCSPSIAPIMKGNRFNLNQCPKNDLKREQMKNIPYASIVGSLMYAQVYTRLDIAFVVGMLGRYQSNLGIDHWKVAKKVMRPLRIYCENSAAIFKAKNNKSTSRNKHLNIKYLTIRECVKEKTVVIEHVSTELMIVDLFTKGAYH
uniref:Retrovirus-related Pol polyprotein from transposon TNT 1-94 n=1 Tax=Vitis vinifera TaxID=29760 RepID=A5BQE0_VITVI|nr:hypothetical protein VITISV_000233 [Vitis vinifera]